MTFPKFHTVRIRTTLAATAVLALALLFSAVVVIQVQRVALTNSITDATRLRANDITQALANGNTPDQVVANNNDDLIVQVIDSSRNVVVSSSMHLEHVTPLSNLRPAPGQEQEARVEYLQHDEQGHYVVIARGVTAAQTSYVVSVANSLETTTKGSVVLGTVFAAGVPLLVVAVGFTIWVVTGKALQPVERMRRKVEQIKSTDSQERLPHPDTEDEIGQLATTMNAMLDRLEYANEKQKRFVSDASHELRSPLTAMKARLEVDLRYPDAADWPTTGQDVLEATERLSRLVEDLLLLARRDGDSAAFSKHQIPIELDTLVFAEIETVRLYSDREIQDAGVDRAIVFGNPDELARMVRNLLDNASRHANHTVFVSLRQEDRDVVLVVGDDGPGVPTSETDRIFERFSRLDDSRARDSGGAGLGLAIVQEIVDGHQGSISVDNRPGAFFTVVLPRHLVDSVWVTPVEQ